MTWTKYNIHLVHVLSAAAIGRLGAVLGGIGKYIITAPYIQVKARHNFFFVVINSLPMYFIGVIFFPDMCANI
jgi:hypothetical protein